MPMESADQRLESAGISAGSAGTLLAGAAVSCAPATLAKVVTTMRSARALIRWEFINPPKRLNCTRLQTCSWTHFRSFIEYTFRSSRRRRSTSSDAFTHTAVCIFRRFCMAWNDCVFEAVGFADGHAGIRGATYHRIHDGFWHG